MSLRSNFTIADLDGPQILLSSRGASMLSNSLSLWCEQYPTNNDKDTLRRWNKRFFYYRFQQFRAFSTLHFPMYWSCSSWRIRPMLHICYSKETWNTIGLFGFSEFWSQVIKTWEFSKLQRWWSEKVWSFSGITSTWNSRISTLTGLVSTFFASILGWLLYPCDCIFANEESFTSIIHGPLK